MSLCVFIRRRGFSTPFQIPPRRYLTPRESAPANLFFSSDCLFDLSLKRGRVRVLVVRVRVVVVRVLVVRVRVVAVRVRVVVVRVKVVVFRVRVRVEVVRVG